VTTPTATRFVFEARLRYDGAGWSAIVPYEGAEADLQEGAHQMGVAYELREAKPETNKARRVKLTGSGDALRRALAEYATRATRNGSYRI
jgi:hypothetical protein